MKAKKRHISGSYKLYSEKLDSFITNFKNSGVPFGNQDRNELKIFKLNKSSVNIKSFRIPNLFNQFAYRFFRKSKAERSYLYGKKLMELRIGTPNPIGYYEFFTPLFFKNSYYLSEQLDCDLTYRDLTKNFDIKDYETILRAFTRFTYNLHKNEINFLDHSPGNTLIKKTENGYLFYLVDLNRMTFGQMDFNDRMKNFSKLTTHKNMVAIMSNEYSKCTGEDEEKIFKSMWEHTKAFQEKFHRKIRFKKRIFFWKKKYKNKSGKSPISDL